MHPYKTRLSAQTLIQLLVFIFFVTIVIGFNLDFIRAFYFHNQITNTGIIINSGILFLFGVGMIRNIYLLWYYWREENAIQRFVKNLEQQAANMAQGVYPQSLILQRYRYLQEMDQKKAKINQSALASILVAQESTLLSVPRFISNILILCGVFGTIVSLSIALLGASNLLDTHQDVSGMGTIIHGMSTALSTTLTAIVCYLFFAYIFQRLTDIQTRIFSAIEWVSNQYLIPQFTHQGDNILAHLSELVSTLNQTAIGMQTVQQHLLSTSQQAHKLMSAYDQRMEQFGENLTLVTQLLQQGFRLPKSSLAISKEKQSDTNKQDADNHPVYPHLKPAQKP